MWFITVENFQNPVLFEIISEMTQNQAFIAHKIWGSDMELKLIRWFLSVIARKSHFEAFWEAEDRRFFFTSNSLFLISSQLRNIARFEAHRNIA